MVEATMLMSSAPVFGHEGTSGQAKTKTVGASRSACPRGGLDDKTAFCRR
jgi:hypothetical protein